MVGKTVSSYPKLLSHVELLADLYAATIKSKLEGQVVGFRQPGDDAHLMLAHLVQVCGHYERRIGHVAHLLRIEEALLDFVDDLAVPHAIAGIAVLDRDQQGKPSPPRRLGRR